jgi:hypothetical protein
LLGLVDIGAIFLAGRLSRVRVEHDAESNGTVERAVVAWAILVFALLFLGLMPLYVFHLNLAKLNKSTQGAPAIALVGILFTAYTPTIAALLIAWLWPGGCDVRSLFRQVVRWRFHVRWYLIALLGPIPLLLLADVLYVAFGGPHQPIGWRCPPELRKAGSSRLSS